MKTQLLFILLFCACGTLFSQARTNVIAAQTFDAVLYKGKTIAEINAIGRSNKSGIEAFIGGVATVKDHPALSSTEYHFGVNNLSFVNNRLFGFRIKDASWPITLNGTIIRVGDPVTKVIGALGLTNPVMIAPSGSDTNYWLSIRKAGDVDDGLAFDIHPTTKVIVSMKYFVVP